MIQSNITYGESINIKLLSDMAVGIGGDRWPAANKFCDLICTTKLYSFYGELFNNKKILGTLL
jgi:hypothetical protein